MSAIGSERGSAGLLVIAGSGLVAAATAVAGALVAGAVTHTRAQSAADVTALAVAGRILADPDPCYVGGEVARGNDARLTDCQLAGASATVAVSIPLPPVLARLMPGEYAVARSRAEVVIVP